MSESATVRSSGPVRADRPQRDERGSGSVLMVGVCVVVMMLGYTAMIICGYVIAGHRARSAADLAALSGATTAGQGGDACAAARRNARRISRGSRPANGSATRSTTSSSVTASSRPCAHTRAAATGWAAAMPARGGQCQAHAVRGRRSDGRPPGR